MAMFAYGNPQAAWTMWDQQLSQQNQQSQVKPQAPPLVQQPAPPKPLYSTPHTGEVDAAGNPAGSSPTLSGWSAPANYNGTPTQPQPSLVNLASQPLPTNLAATSNGTNPINTQDFLLPPVQDNPAKPPVSPQESLIQQQAAQQNMNSQANSILAQVAAQQGLSFGNGSGDIPVSPTPPPQAQPSQPPAQPTPYQQAVQQSQQGNPQAVAQNSQQQAIDSILAQVASAVQQGNPMDPLIQQLVQQAIELSKQPNQVGNYIPQVQALMSQLNNTYQNNDYASLVQQAAQSQRDAALDQMKRQFQGDLAAHGLGQSGGASAQMLSELMSPIYKNLLAQQDQDLLAAAQARTNLGTGLLGGYGDLMKNEALAGQLGAQRLSSLADLAGNLGTVSYQPTKARIDALNALLQSQTTGNDLAYKSAMLQNTLANSAQDRALQQQQMTQAQQSYATQLASLQQQLADSQQQARLALDQYNNITKPQAQLQLSQAQQAAAHQAQLAPLQQQAALLQAQQQLNQIKAAGSGVSSGTPTPNPMATGGVPTASQVGMAGLAGGGAVGGGKSASGVTGLENTGSMYTSNYGATQVTHPFDPSSLNATRPQGGTGSGSGLAIDPIGAGLAAMNAASAALQNYNVPSTSGVSTMPSLLDWARGIWDAGSSAITGGGNVPSTSGVSTMPSLLDWARGIWDAGSSAITGGGSGMSPAGYGTTSIFGDGGTF